MKLTERIKIAVEKLQFARGVRKYSRQLDKNIPGYKTDPNIRHKYNLQAVNSLRAELMAMSDDEVLAMTKQAKRLGIIKEDC